MDVEESPWADTNQPSEQSNQQAPASQTDATPSQQSSSSAAPSATSPRTRGPRRLVAQPTRLEAVEDPLGPLGAAPDDNAATPLDAPPVPPQKEQMVMRTSMPQHQQARRPADPHSLDDDDLEGPRGGRLPPPVDAARPSSVRSGTHPSMSVEQAAKPSFQIYVGDPVKIGDLTSSHIVYSVRTKVSTIAGSLQAAEPSSLTRCGIRLHRRPINNPNSRSSDDTAISYGFTTLSMPIIPAMLSRRRPKSRRWVDSIATLSKAGELRWRRCSTRPRRILHSSTTVI